MNSLRVLGKFLDQPILVGNFSRTVPAVLITAGTVYTAEHINHTPEKEKKKEFIKSICVFTATIASALVAPKVAKFILEKFESKAKNVLEHHENIDVDVVDLKEIKEENIKLIETFLNSNVVPKKVRECLHKAKTKVLNPKEIKTVYENLSKNNEGQQFLRKLIPDPENIDSKHIFGEIGRLSIIGLVPVLGGITGGVIGDRITEKDWKERVPDKIKEGSYQYLANIFLCNVGAGVALAIMEKLKIKTKAVRAFGMVGGIILTGIVLGSAMANFIGKKFIDPLLGKKHNGNEKLFSERTPEALDISLHIDDVATVAVLSGLKWIEPALPVLYAISGYRAGIGYRNGKENA